MKKFLKIPIEDIVTDANSFCHLYVLKKELNSNFLCEKSSCQQCLDNFFEKYTVEEDEAGE